jgi:perosamine synthetase
MEEYDSMKDCFESNWVTEGPKSAEFVDKLCDIIGSKYGVLAPNGTLALYLGLRGMGIGPGDEVIVPNFTFIASANAVLMTGAIPVFVDVDLGSLQIDVKDASRVLSKKTKAIMPVHIYGAASNMTEVNAFAKQEKIKVIEDAAQAMGVFWEGQHCGGLGDVGCFSFFADKTITTIEGGFVCTDDEEIYEKLLYLRNQGRLNRGTFIHPEIGFNFRMNDIQASIGLEQLTKKEWIYKRKKEIYSFYTQSLKNVEDIEILKPQLGSTLVPFRVCISAKENKEALVNFLCDAGIESRTYFYPLNKQPCFQYLKEYQNLDNFLFKNSITAFERGICLPSYPALKEEEINYICNKIKEFYHVI